MRTEYLLDKEVELILAAMRPGNSLVCQVCLHTGLRVSDALNLKIEQMKPRFWITEGKTGKRKLIGLPEDLRLAIYEHNREAGGGPWCFPGVNPEKHRTRQAVWKDVKRATEYYRIRANAGPHSFRKVYACDLMEMYGDLEKVQRALNHDNLAVTLIYTTAAQMLEGKKGKALKRAYRAGRR